MKNKHFYASLILAVLFLGLIFLVSNHSSAASGSVRVGATIDSRVSATNSYITLSAAETLADPENHPILMTVYLLDTGGNAVPDITVECNSSRGSVDIVELFASDGQTILDTNSGKSDENGIIRFRLSSYTPGSATFSVLVDTLLSLTDQNVKFTALPFPGNIEVSVQLPPAMGGHKLVIIPSNTGSSGSEVTEQTEETAQAWQVARTASDIGTTLNIPFWLISSVILLATLLPLLLIIIIFLALKSRKQQKKELLLLEQIAQAEHVDQVKYYVDNNHRQS